LVRLDEKPLHVDALAEIAPNDEEALTRWLGANFNDYTGNGFLPTYCGFHPAQRVFARESVYTRRFADPGYLAGLIAEQAKVSSTRDWQMTALNPIEGTIMSTDGVARPGLLEVHDTGPGLSADDLEHAFERFYLHRKYSGLEVGSGLGLAIVGRIVETHRGKVRIKSRPGRGTTISILLPC